MSNKDTNNNEEQETNILNPLVDYKHRTKPLSNRDQLIKAKCNTVEDVSDNNNDTNSNIPNNTTTNNTNNINNNSNTKEDKDTLDNYKIDKQEYINSRLKKTSSYTKEPNEYDLIDYNGNYKVPSNNNPDIPNNQTLDDTLVYYIHQLTTGKQIEYNLTPETIAMSLIGYENYCIQTNNYPSWSGIAKYIGVTKNVLLDRLKNNEEYHTLYNIILNRLEELTISRTMNQYGKFGIDMLEHKFGEGDWNVRKNKQEISIKLESIDKKYDKNIGDML